jgi:hypothetical protein
MGWKSKAYVSYPGTLDYAARFLVSAFFSCLVKICDMLYLDLLFNQGRVAVPVNRDLHR